MIHRLQGSPHEIALVSRREATAIPLASGFEALEVAGEAAALRLLQPHASDPGRRATLRRALAESRSAADVARLADAEVHRALARLLAAGELLLIARRQPVEARAPAIFSPPTPREVEQAVREERPLPPPKPPRTWIEIELVDEEGRPVPGKKYRLELPDGEIREGTLDSRGLARVDGIDPGTCQISFPELDEETWSPA